MNKTIWQNHTLRGLLSCLAVIVFGFILLNATFLAAFLFNSAIDLVLRLFIRGDLNMDLSWYPLLKHMLFFMIIAAVSWIVLRRRLKPLYKAIFMVVPLTTAYVSLGIFLYRWPTIAFISGLALFIGVLLYLRKIKAYWLYYFALILMSTVMVLTWILGVDI
jgi:hypothetical protein